MARVTIPAATRVLVWELAKLPLFVLFVYAILRSGRTGATPDWTWLPLVALAVFFLARTLARLVSQFMRRNELIVLDEAGITDRSYGLGFIPWANIRGARLDRHTKRGFGFSREYQIVVLDIADPEAYLNSDRSLARRLVGQGGGGFWLNTYNVSRSPEDVLRLVRGYIAQYSPLHRAG